MRPLENKPLLLLELYVRGKSVCIRFRYEQSPKEIKAGMPANDYIYNFDAETAASIAESSLMSVRLPQWIIITSLNPFTFKIYNTSMDMFIK